MRAFLEKIEGDYMDDFVFISKYQLRNLGVEVIDFDGTNLKSLDKYSFDLKNDILIGSVEATCLFFAKCGIEVPRYLGYPDQLKEHFHRNIRATTFGKLVDVKPPYFIKPKNGVKSFTGCLVKDIKSHQFIRDYYPEVSDDTEIYLSEPIEFISEYRCFIHKGVLKGIQWYAGDFTVFPNTFTIHQMVKDFKDCPVSYTLDVGIYDIAHSKTALVEINDMWAIGSYGFDAKQYVRMVIDRFQEINRTAIKTNV